MTCIHWSLSPQISTKEPPPSGRRRRCLHMRSNSRRYGARSPTLSTHTRTCLRHLSTDGLPDSLRNLFDGPKRCLGLLRFLKETHICARLRTAWEPGQGSFDEGQGSGTGLSLYRPYSTILHTHTFQTKPLPVSHSRASVAYFYTFTQLDSTTFVHAHYIKKATAPERPHRSARQPLKPQLYSSSLFVHHLFFSL